MKAKAKQWRWWFCHTLPYCVNTVGVCEGKAHQNAALREGSAGGRGRKHLLKTAVAEDVQLPRRGGVHVVQAVRVQLVEVHLDFGTHCLSVHGAFQDIERRELGDGHLCYFSHRTAGRTQQGGGQHARVRVGHWSSPAPESCSTLVCAGPESRQIPNGHSPMANFSAAARRTLVSDIRKFG